LTSNDITIIEVLDENINAEDRHLQKGGFEVVNLTFSGEKKIF
jgi:hypothetical protein